MKTSLYYREGSSDKEYHVELVPLGGLFVVNFSFGRRGSTLNTGTKTPAPVSEAKAKEIFAKLVREKKAKGYTEGVNGAPYQNSEAAGRVSGRTPQLLNPIEEDELETYMAQRTWCMQEKFDGKRLMLLKEGTTVLGINRKGLFVGIPTSFVELALRLPWDFLIDGEAVGEMFHAFDLLEASGECIRKWRYAERLQKLSDMLAATQAGAIKPVATIVEREEKREFLRRLRDAGARALFSKISTRHSHRVDRPAADRSSSTSSMRTAPLSSKR